MTIVSSHTEEDLEKQKKIDAEVERLNAKSSCAAYGYIMGAIRIIGFYG